MKKKLLPTILFSIFLSLNAPLYGNELPKDQTDQTIYSYFIDVPPSHWAFRIIYQITGQGYMRGYPNHSFLPDQNITQKEFNNSLSLLTKDHLTITISLDEDESMTRGEAASVLYSVIQAISNVDNILNDKHITFKDVSVTNRSIAYCVRQNIMTGYPDGSFKPFRKITRAEAAVILYNLDRLDYNYHPPE